MATSISIDKLQSAASEFRKLNQTPTVRSAFLSKNDHVTVVMGQKDLSPATVQMVSESSAITLKKSVKSFQLQAKDAHDLYFSDTNSIPVPLGDDIHVIAPSPSGELCAYVRKFGKGSKDSKFMLEIWRGDQIIDCQIMGVNKLEKESSGKSKEATSAHGFVYNDNWFGTLLWSPDEKRIAYTADPSPPKTNSFFTDKSMEDEDESALGNQYQYQEDWGETYTDRYESKLFVYELDTHFFHPVPTDSLGRVAVGLAEWSPDSKTIAFTCWDVSQPRLGMVYCFNRRCGVYYTTVSADGSAKNDIIKVSEGLPSARCPRFSPSGNLLAFYGVHDMRPHNSCCSLEVYNLKSKERKTWVQVKDKVRPGEFSGLFKEKLPLGCFVSESAIWLDTAMQGRVRIVAVGPEKVQLVDPSLKFPQSFLSAIDQRSVNASPRKRVKSEDSSASKFVNKTQESCSFQILCVGKKGLLATVSTPALPAVLGFYNFASNNWYALPLSKDAIQNTTWLKNNSTWDFETVTFSEFEWIQYILLSPTTNSKPAPCIVYPHGGPHATFTTDFIIQFSYLVSQGYSVLLVNYRGTIGFGQSMLLSLLGKCGAQDVYDCVACVHDAAKKKRINLSDLYVLGGSHGGFLTGHLVGLRWWPKGLVLPYYPTDHVSKKKSTEKPLAIVSFKAAAMRNPVTNISTMVGQTDIPDWCEAEAGSGYLQALSQLHDDQEGIAPEYASAVSTMVLASPMRAAHLISTPTLIMLGDNDRRVPNSQGLQLFKYLQRRGSVPTQCFWYPETGHAIAKPHLEADSTLQVLRWFSKHSS